MKRTIVCLGEGHADCHSLPTLLIRVAQFLGEEPPILQEPIRFKRNRLLKEDELPRLIAMTRKKLRTPGGVLIVLDADEDCPAELGPAIMQRASGLFSDMPVAAVVAKRMFEVGSLRARKASSRRGRSARRTCLRIRKRSGVQSNGSRLGLTAETAMGRWRTSSG